MSRPVMLIVGDCPPAGPCGGADHFRNAIRYRNRLCRRGQPHVQKPMAFPAQVQLVEAIQAFWLTCKVAHPSLR